MPHVFTLEGPNLAALGTASGSVEASGSGMTITHYPTNGTPLAPAGDPIGPARPPTPVFGPGGTPVMYRRSFPARGPVCDYCDPSMIVFTNNGLGDGADFFDQQSTGAQIAMLTGGTIIAGGILGALAIFVRRRVIRHAARSED